MPNPGGVAASLGVLASGLPWLMLAALLAGCSLLPSGRPSTPATLEGTWLVIEPSAGGLPGMVLDGDGQFSFIGVDALANLTWRRDGNTLVVIDHAVAEQPPQELRVEIGKLTATELQLASTARMVLPSRYRRDDRASGRIDGTLRYDSGELLPAGAVVRVELLDLDTAGEPTLVEGRLVPVAGRSSPLAIRFHYLRAALRPAGHYALVATVAVDGETRYRSIRPQPLDHRQPQSGVVLELRRAPPPRASLRLLGRLPQTFAGDLPCASCPGIRTRLTLWPDGTFMLHEQRLESAASPGDLAGDHGRWEVVERGTLLLLRSRAVAPRVFAVTPSGGLRLLDEHGRELPGSESYRVDPVAYDPLAVPGEIDAVVTWPGSTPSLLDCVTGRRYRVAPGATIDALRSRLAVAGGTRRSTDFARLQLALAAGSNPVDRTPVVELRQIVGTAPGGDCGRPIRAFELTGTDWRPVTLAGALVIHDEDGTAPYLRFDAGSGRLTGHGGCNRLFGRFRAVGERLSIEQVGMTRMACPRHQELETRTVEALDRVGSFRVEGDRLDLYTVDGRHLGHWRAAP